MRVYISSNLSKHHHTRSQTHVCTAHGIIFNVLTTPKASLPTDDPPATVSYAASTDTSSDPQVTDTYTPIDSSVTDSPASPSIVLSSAPAAAPSAAAPSNSLTTTTSTTTTLTETITVSSINSSTSTPMPVVSTVTVDASGQQCEL
jgi:hypothetical protein